MSWDIDLIVVTQRRRAMPNLNLQNLCRLAPDPHGWSARPSALSHLRGDAIFEMFNQLCRQNTENEDNGSFARHLSPSDHPDLRHDAFLHHFSSILEGTPAALNVA
jgi:hypothetical protein